MRLCAQHFPANEAHTPQHRRSQWQLVPRAQPPQVDPSDPTCELPGTGDQRVSHNAHWFPVVGTQLEFMHHLHDSWLACRVHAWWKKWHRACNVRRVQRCFIEPAVLGAAHVQPWQRNWVLAHIDFSAAVKITRLAEVRVNIAPSLPQRKKGDVFTEFIFLLVGARRPEVKM